MAINSNTEPNLLQKIKIDFPGFNEDEILDYTKFVIPNIHFLFKEGKYDQIKKYCTEDIINKMLENKEEYRISKNIDTVRIGYARIDDYKNENGDIYIKVYVSIFFYDEIANNETIDSKYNFDKYWNDIWQITFKGSFEKDEKINCPFCGNIMTYNRSKYMYTCEHCKDSIFYSKNNWKVVEIDVNKIVYR